MYESISMDQAIRGRPMLYDDREETKLPSFECNIPVVTSIYLFILRGLVYSSC